MKFITFGIEKIVKEKFRDQSMANTRDILRFAVCNKPCGGLWASPYLGPDSDYASAWEEWCSNECWTTAGGVEHGIIFELNPNARILTINSVEDMANVYKRYPFNSDKLSSPSLDYVKMSKDYDVFYITDNGFWLNRDNIFSNGWPSTYSWDVESIVILNFDAINLDSQEYFKNPHELWE